MVGTNHSLTGTNYETLTILDMFSEEKRQSIITAEHIINNNTASHGFYLSLGQVNLVSVKESQFLKSVFNKLDALSNISK